jgi:hypothetical protein
METALEDQRHQDCTVAILTMYRPDHVLRAVQSVLPQLSRGDSILVLDQCVGNCECQERIQRAVRPEEWGLLRVIRISTLSGLTQARNYVLARVSTPLILFLDDDAELLPGALTYLRRALDNEEMVGAGVIQDTDAKRMWYYWYRIFRRGVFRDQRQELNLGPRKQLEENAPLPGGGAMLRTDTARRVAFDEGFVSYSMGEDIEFTNRLLTVGKTCLIPEARIRHERSPDARDRSARSEMRDAVTSLHYIYKCHPKSGVEVSAAYIWAQVGLCVRAAAASVSARSVAPALGWLNGWSSVSRGLSDLPFLSHR